MELFQQRRNMTIPRSSVDHTSCCIDWWTEADRAAVQATQQEQRCSDPVVLGQETHTYSSFH